MAERETTDLVGTEARYAKAVLIETREPAKTEDEPVRLRTTTTRRTTGTLKLRYAPRTPRAAGPVDTAS